MGMDVYGNAPSSKRGEYFRASVWGWHPLWDACEAIAPEIAGLVKYGHSNDGDGLDAEHSRALAAAIREALAGGSAERWLRDRSEEIAALPRETCEMCAGTGRRKHVPSTGAGVHGCNGCGGEYNDDPEKGREGCGTTEPWASHYRVDREDLEEFSAFLADCGGFRIL